MNLFSLSLSNICPKLHFIKKYFLLCIFIFGHGYKGVYLHKISLNCMFKILYFILCNMFPQYKGFKKLLYN